MACHHPRFLALLFTLLTLLTITHAEFTLSNRRCAARICFAMDGSGSVKPAGFDYQVHLVQRTVRLLVNASKTASYSAVQYGLKSISISLSEKDPRAFKQRVREASFQDAQETFLAAGLAYCAQETGLAPEPEKGARVGVVVLGDGRSSFGLSALPVAAKVFGPGSKGTLVAVGVGPARNAAFWEKLVGGVAGRYVDASGDLDRDARRILRNLCVATPI